MDNNKYKKLEYITNGIRAANKINEIYNSRIQARDGSGIMPSRLSMLNEILKTIAQYYPGPHGSLLSNAVIKSTEYSEAYKNVKHQINMARNNGIDADMVINTLKYIRPLLRGQHMHTIDKVIRIYDIIKS